ncbi:hypothetical protein [Pseudonocardia alaniniphila]|uniref:Uncharacterized protein n=1 Tax=Pseudonocardia alaniniphila TaxID=75291 RepID=A0ABS9TMT2_9PSEU|nr:hypothetical protein [Pseudonocardia alaniniphila]MCH6169844.1 hypothetical protein [Pseudonocardia alaniniphila]
MSSAERRMTVIVSAHVNPTTAIDYTVYPAENRATVSLEGSGLTNVTLFAERPELVRLRDALAALVAELDEKRAALNEHEAHSAA